MRRAECCWMTKSSGPLRAAGTPAAGSGVASNLRLAEYSLSFSFAIGKFYDAAVCGRERLFLQGVEGQLLSQGHAARRHAAFLRRTPAHGGDQQHLLPDAQDERAGELGKADAGELQVRHQGLA